MTASPGRAPIPVATSHRPGQDPVLEIKDLSVVYRTPGGDVRAVDKVNLSLAPGEEVYGMPWFPRAAGGYAEFVTAPARQLARTPDVLTDEQAAGLPLAGLTAWQSLVDIAGVGEGDRVLIKGSHSTHLDEVVRELTEV